MSEKELLNFTKEIIGLIDNTRGFWLDVFSLVSSLLSICLSGFAIFLAWKIYNSTREVAQKTDRTIEKVSAYAENTQRDIREVIIKSIMVDKNVTYDQAELAAAVNFPGIIGEFKGQPRSQIISNEVIDNGNKFIVEIDIPTPIQNPSVGFYKDKDVAFESAKIVDTETKMPSGAMVKPSASVAPGGILHIHLPNPAGNRVTLPGKYTLTVEATKQNHPVA